MKPTTVSFRTQVKVLTIGNIVAQGLILGSLPIIAKLYPIREIGLYSVFAAIAATVLPASTLRLRVRNHDCAARIDIPAYVIVSRAGSASWRLYLLFRNFCCAAVCARPMERHQFVQSNPLCTPSMFQRLVRRVVLLCLPDTAKRGGSGEPDGRRLHYGIHPAST